MISYQSISSLFYFLRFHPTHTLLLLYSELSLSVHFPMHLFLFVTTPKQNLSAINKTVQHILYKKSESPASFLYNGQSHTAKLPIDICRRLSFGIVQIFISILFTSQFFQNAEKAVDTASFSSLVTASFCFFTRSLYSLYVFRNLSNSSLLALCSRR